MKDLADSSILLNNMSDSLLFRQLKSVKAGQIERFKIEYNPHADGDEIIIPPNLYIKIKNLEPISKRAIYLAGPYILYVDCKSCDYDSNQKYFVTADHPSFEPQLLPGQSFYVQLSCHTLKKHYCWEVDVISQIIFNNTIEIDFEITIGTSREILHDSSNAENSDKIGTFHHLLKVYYQDTLDLWNLPIPKQNKPRHLVILTHGLHSNVSVDMLYLKEQIDKFAKENESEEEIVVKGYFGNIGKTERGIKYLGSRVAEYIIELINDNENLNNGQTTKISFIGHSLGGCVQTFAIAYLKINFPWFFDQIKPINFVTVSSPLLGVVNENPMYVKLVLSAGLVGKTGQEMGLKILENNSKPLLLLLPTGATHQVLKKFQKRTVYANAINDGIVPLRTSSLLYLDYRGLAKIINSDELANSEKTDKVPKNVEKVNKFHSVQTLLSYFMPFQKSTEDNHKDGYLRDQLTGTDIEIPNSTFLDSAASIILPPVPSIKLIVDPSSRENPIIHDKVYYEDDLPPVDKPNIEETIAREYHKSMSWRKVIVKLKPDAHNNIIVRRRFANAYGWPVIQHLVENHFKDSEVKELPNISSLDSLDEELDLSKIVSRDLIAKQNNEIDQTTTEEEISWINSKDNSDSVFALGVTGLIGEITGMMGDFRDQIYKYSLNPPTLPIIGQIPIPQSLAPNEKPEENNETAMKLMNDFI
ncbi:unnamed protein product [Candida verbasci]|uniref:DUF676 domain-containing protein n=1 Tax=Candida verbasci TaxID=1227364 RepID=A0A9W4U080_9ASCO|nr:unnamed protein product [Candida verbasci]